MQKTELWGWDKKIRTMLRFVKPGDIFCFELKNGLFCFGRIIAKVATGHLAEILDYVSDKPCINLDNIEKGRRLGEPIILDSYGLFDRKAEGEWRIIGHQEEYKAPDFDDIYLTFGIGDDWKRRDLYGNTTKITKEEHFRYILVSPKGDDEVKEFVRKHIDNVKIFK